MIKMDIKTLAFIGAGFMGTNIALRSILYDYRLKIFDTSNESLAACEKTLTGFLKRKGMESKGDLISFHSDLSEVVDNADLIIEAIPERLDLKKKVFSKIDELAPPHAIIATNSSSFPVSKIEDSVKRKDKVLNLHFYAPIPTVPMVDIMKGTQTSEETFEKGKEWIESIECYPLVVKRECLGFVFNRVWRAVKKECLKIWEGGYADVETVDKAWRIFTGMAMGPFQMMDGVGLDVILDVENSYYNESGDPSDNPPDELKSMVEAGDLGLKSGKGFYTYRRKRKK